MVLRDMALRAIDRLQMGEQNAHMLDALITTQICVRTLVQRGYTVLSVAIEGRNPVVWIQHSQKCDKLDGGMMVRSVGRAGRQTTMAAELWGCQVQWQIAG